MEIKARGVERPVIAVSVGGFEVTIGVETGRIPEATSEIGKQREWGPQLRDFSDEYGVFVDGSKGVVKQAVLPLLYLSHCSVYALPSVHVGFCELSFRSQQTQGFCLCLAN